MEKFQIGLCTLFNQDPDHFISKTKNLSSLKNFRASKGPELPDWLGWGWYGACTSRGM